MRSGRKSLLDSCRVTMKLVAGVMCALLVRFCGGVMGQNFACQVVPPIVVDSDYSLDEVRTALYKAATCANGTRVSVTWVRETRVTETLVVDTDVILEVTGKTEDGEDERASAVDANSTGLFEVKTSGTLSLVNMTLRGGWGNEDAGGIYLHGASSLVTCNGCIFDSFHNSNADSGGGAIHVTDEGEVRLEGNNVFRNCSSVGQGGAIFFDDGNGMIDGTVILEDCKTAGDGGGVSMKRGHLELTPGSRTIFNECSSVDKGGALYMTHSAILVIGSGASLEVTGCVANSSDSKGAGLYASDSDVEIGPNAVVSFTNNSALEGATAGGLYGDTSRVVLDAGAKLSFINNRADNNGGGLQLERNPADDDEVLDYVNCLSMARDASIVLSGNQASNYGGGAYFGAGCSISLSGTVLIENNEGERGGGIYVEEANVSLSGEASFINNHALRWGGAISVFDSPEWGFRVTGDVSFTRNHAERSGGAAYVENALLMVTNNDALWAHNRAGYDGGAVAVDGGEAVVDGGLYGNNTALQRGGALFATGESFVTLTGVRSERNEAASGGALYISDANVELSDVEMSGDRAPFGAVVFLAGASARAVQTRWVAQSEMSLSGSFPLQVDTSSSFRAFACSFEGWNGPSPCVLGYGDLVLDSCDFSGSENDRLVQSSSPVTVRNAIVGNENFAAADYNFSALLADKTHTCDSLPREHSCLESDVAGIGDGVVCLDADNGMGVLCSMYEANTTGDSVSLSDSATLLLDMDASSETRFAYPDEVTQVLVLKHDSDASSTEENGSQDGATLTTSGTLWELRIADGTEDGGEPDESGRFLDEGSPDGFWWSALPLRGYLPMGYELDITLVASPPPLEVWEDPSDVYNGEVRATFFVRSLTSSEAPQPSVTFEGEFYYCEAGSYWDGSLGECISCAENLASGIAGTDTLDCTSPGATLTTLPLKEGYWRSDKSQTFIRPCLVAEACVGGTGLSASDGSSYCAEGYEGIFCSQCADGYRRLAGNGCSSCDDTWGFASHAVIWALVFFTPLTLGAIVVYLVGGSKALWGVVHVIKELCCGCRREGVDNFSGSVDDAGESGRRSRRDRASMRSRLSSPKFSLKGFLAKCFQAIPFQQLKILIVVWQILSEFSALSEVPYPSIYKRFLRWVNVFNFDLSWPLSASCYIRSLSFYERLVLSTLTPLGVVLCLALIYLVALNFYPGVSHADIEARRGATVRHATAVLLVSFLVFSSVSTTVFSTFSCDEIEDLETDTYRLRADYRIACHGGKYRSFQVYAAAMIILYPVGIPLMFAYVLLKRRSKINPQIMTVAKVRPFDVEQAMGKRPLDRRDPHCSSTMGDRKSARRENSSWVDYKSPPPSYGRNHLARRQGSLQWSTGRLGRSAAVASVAVSVPQGGDGWGGAHEAAGDRGCSDPSSRRSDSRADTGSEAVCGSGSRDGGNLGSPTHDADRRELEREKVLQERLDDPDLQPTRFLWEPYEPSNYYYETVECGRRCLLTGALVFVMPNTAGQVAGACVFAFVSLLVFELLRPHLSTTDSWMYRTGCVIIFFSNFLGLMAKADVSGEQAQSQEIFGYLLILVHFGMVVAIMVEAYFGMQAMSDERDDYVQRLHELPPMRELLKGGQKTRGKKSAEDCSGTSRSAGQARCAMVSQGPERASVRPVLPSPLRLKPEPEVQHEDDHDQAGGRSTLRAERREPALDVGGFWEDRRIPARVVRQSPSSEADDENMSVLSQQRTSRIGALTFSRLVRSGRELEDHTRRSPSIANRTGGFWPRSSSSRSIGVSAREDESKASLQLDDAVAGAHKTFWGEEDSGGSSHFSGVSRSSPFDALAGAQGEQSVALTGSSATLDCASKIVPTKAVRDRRNRRTQSCSSVGSRNGIFLSPLSEIFDQPSLPTEVDVSGCATSRSSEGFQRFRLSRDGSTSTFSGVTQDSLHVVHPPIPGPALGCRPLSPLLFPRNPSVVRGPAGDFPVGQCSVPQSREAHPGGSSRSSSSMRTSDGSGFPEM